MSEKHGKLGSALRFGAVGALALSAGWCVAGEQVIDGVFGDAGEIPAAPKPPKPVEAHRDPIKLGLGFDRTKSEIRREFPRVISVTREFLERTGVFLDGDQVSACTFAEDASCQTFSMPGDKDALLTHISGLRIDDRRPNEMETHVQRSVRSILEQAGLANMADPKQGLALVWTDAHEEGESVGLPGAHAPVTIVVPEGEYLARARQVAQELGSGVSAALAEDSQTFGSLLEGRANALEQTAQARAQAEADALAAIQKAAYEAQLAAYNQEKDGLEARKVAAQATRQKIERGIQVGLGAIAGILLAVYCVIERLRNRPTLYGYIVDARNKGVPRFTELPSRVNSVDLSELNPGLPQIIIKAGKDGLYIGQERIRAGMDISGNGCFWEQNVPDLKRLREFMKK